MSPIGPPSAGYPASARWHVFRSPDSDFSPRPIRVHPSPFAGQHSPLRASAPLREISLCVASFAPAHVALRAAFGRLPGQRPLARVPVSAFRFPVSSSPAFTLIELLVTVTVIAILAGITLGAMGGVNQKATRDKTKAEIAAISNALEQYKSVNDSYPTAGGNSTVPFAATGATIRPFYIANKVQTNSSGQLQDPYGNAYKYKTPGDNNPASFDVWTTDSKGNTIGNW
jgi:general secretion pathway protein G